MCILIVTSCCSRYIQGATSPKNIIILIDASGSMHGVPMRIAKLSAQNLIDTFGDNDFFNVVYVSTYYTLKQYMFCRSSMTTSLCTLIVFTSAMQRF